MKVLFLATDKNKMQLMHLLLNAIHAHEAGNDVTVVLECASTRLLIGLADQSIKLPLFNKALELGIIDHACKACTTSFSAVEAAKKLEVPLKGPLHGHTNLLEFMSAEYWVVTF